MRSTNLSDLKPNERYRNTIGKMLSYYHNVKGLSLTPISRRYKESEFLILTLDIVCVVVLKNKLKNKF